MFKNNCSEFVLYKKKTAIKQLHKKISFGYELFLEYHSENIIKLKETYYLLSLFLY